MKHAYTRCHSTDAICLMLTFSVEPTYAAIRCIREKLAAWDVHSLASVRRGLEAEAAREQLKEDWQAELDRLRSELGIAPRRARAIEGRIAERYALEAAAA